MLLWSYYHSTKWLECFSSPSSGQLIYPPNPERNKQKIISRKQMTPQSSVNSSSWRLRTICFYKDKVKSPYFKCQHDTASTATTRSKSSLPSNSSIPNGWTEKRPCAQDQEHLFFILHQWRPDPHAATKQGPNAFEGLKVLRHPTRRK